MCEPGVVWCEEPGSVTHSQESLCLVVPVSCQDMCTSLSELINPQIL